MFKELNKVVKDSIVEYKDENEFLKYNGLDKDDFNQWAIRGVSDDGFFELFDCYCLAGDATNDNYMKITDVSQITDLLLCEIKESGFNDTAEEICEDPNNLTDADILELFFEYVTEVAVFPCPAGRYKGGLMLVINQD